MEGGRRGGGGGANQTTVKNYTLKTKMFGLTTALMTSWFFAINHTLLLLQYITVIWDNQCYVHAKVCSNNTIIVKRLKHTHAIIT